MTRKFVLMNWALLLSLVMLWGTSFTLISIAIESMDPLSVVFGRVSIGALLLTIMVYAKGRCLPFDRKSWAAFLIMGAMGNVVPFFLITWGEQSIDSGMAGMIMAVMPLMTMLLAHYFIQGETLNRYKIIGFMLGLGGITMLLGPVFEGGGPAVWGGIAVFFAAFSYAVNTILVRRFPQFNALVGAAGVLIGASLIMFPIWWLHSPIKWADVDAASLSAVIWLGIGPTAIATLILFAVIERAGPTFLSTINYMIPVVAFLTGVLILSEPFSSGSVISMAVILCGIALTRFRATQNKSPSAS